LCPGFEHRKICISLSHNDTVWCPYQTPKALIYQGINNLLSSHSEEAQGAKNHDKTILYSARDWQELKPCVPDDEIIYTDDCSLRKESFLAADLGGVAPRHAGGLPYQNSHA
jgi:hypothetical protein